MKKGWKNGGETAGYCRPIVKLPADRDERLSCPF